MDFRHRETQADMILETQRHREAQAETQAERERHRKEMEDIRQFQHLMGDIPRPPTRTRRTRTKEDLSKEELQRHLDRPVGEIVKEMFRSKK